MYQTRRKLLSQNFLHNRKLVKRLIRSSFIGKTDTVLEIGPGQGIITEELLNQAEKVIAVEIDKKLFDRLKVKFSFRQNLELYCADFLSFPLPAKPYKVFSNLPFRKTSDIIRRLLDLTNPPVDSYLIVQKEAAEKLIKGSLISVFYYPWFRFSIIHKFSQKDFIPAPKVKVVLLEIQKRTIPLVSLENKTLFQDFIVYIFSRKKPYVVDLDNCPTKIKLSRWLELFNRFLVKADSARINQIRGAAKKLLTEQEKLSKIHRTRKDKNWKNFREEINQFPPS